MKKIVLLLFSIIGLSAYAQFPLEGIAADFTATDIDGNEHHLQDYLDDGKIVILDFFATWCTPCWEYHDSHVYANLYKTLGPEGSDDIVLLAIESDPATTMDDLQGLTEVTQGNWLKGTPYPVIDNHTIRYSYDVTGYPTSILICPDGSQAFLQGPAGNPDIYGHYINQISSCAGNGFGVVENHAEITARPVWVCDDSGVSNLNFGVKNYGTNEISDFEVVLKEDGNVIYTQAYSEDFERYSEENFILDDAVEFKAGHEYVLEFSQINGEAPFGGLLESKEIDFGVSTEIGNYITVVVHADSYPDEISWEITDSSNNIVASGGPYDDAEELAVITHYVTIPEGVEDCYNVTMYDGYGDGWSVNYGWTNDVEEVDPGIEIISNGNRVAFLDAMNFNDEITDRYVFKTNGVLGADTPEIAEFKMYPNPSNGIFSFSTGETVGITVLDLTGKVVYTKNEIRNGDTVNVAHLQKGVYLAKISGATLNTVKKIIIK